MEEIFQERVAELDRITAERDAKKQIYDDLKKQRLTQFMEGFTAISLKLKEMYQVGGYLPI